MKLQVKIFMNKIILAINSMIQNSDKISNVSVFNDEYFFNYKGYTWGILELGPWDKITLHLSIC